MKFIAVFFLSAVWRLQATEAVGCDTNPCEHQCIDTIDSYYCQCWPNYELEDDDSSCISLTSDVIDTYYIGCYEEDPDLPDFQYQIWTRDDATIKECVRSCSTRSFLYAALQEGDECWCDNSYARLYNETDACDIPCSGEDNEMCGGIDALSVYAAPVDDRYMGCWYEDEDDREMAHFVYNKSSLLPPADCIDACSLSGFKFAALFDGGDCYCGDSYGLFGLAGALECNVSCLGGYASSNCGSNTTNAIYRVVQARDLSPLMKKEDLRGTIYFGDYLFDFPSKQGILTRRMVTYSSGPINIPGEDLACAAGNCYDLCGSITQPPGYDLFNTEDMIIRDFHINISQVMPKYIDDKDYVPKRVHIFAQTLVIDASVSFPFSVYLRASQIIIDYSVNPSITFDENGEELELNLTKAIYDGPPSDLSFQKLSVLCARMLMGSNDETNLRMGFHILDDIMTDRAYTEEQGHYINAVRSYRSNFTSIGRNNLHWAPYYSKAYYTTTLDLFYAEIEHYADEYDALIADYEDCDKFKTHSSALLSIWLSTILDHSDTLREDAKAALDESEATYLAILDEYRNSRQVFLNATVVFVRGLIDWAKESIKDVMGHLIRSLTNLFFGRFPCGAIGLVKELQEIIGVIKALIPLVKTMENLAYTVFELQRFMINVKIMMTTERYGRYMDNVEAVAELYPMIAEWDSLKLQIDLIFQQPELAPIGGSQEFSEATKNMCNWGKSLTRSVTEYAQMVREYVKFDSIHKSNEDMYDRYLDYYENIGEECEQKAQMAVGFYEQNYDVMLTTNDLLIQFCEAFYYEHLQPCPEDALPEFDADLRELLTQIDEAIYEASAYERRSKANLEIVLTDPDDTLDNCTDSNLCPIKVLRETGYFVYDMGLDERRLQGIDLFLVNSLYIQFTGVESPDEDKRELRLDVSKEGPFMNRRNDKVSTFYSRGVTSMTYQYDIDTGATELFCDLVSPDGASALMIRQACPFTRWHVKVDPYSAGHIDLSGITSVNFTLNGTYLNFMDDDSPDYSFNMD